MKFSLLLSLFTVLLFNACSTKEVFEPKNLSDDWEMYESSKYEVLDVSSNIALLDDRSVLSQDGRIDVTVAQNQRVVTYNSEWIITASIDGNITLTSVEDSSVQKSINLKKTVASANVEKNILAVIFADNEIALYDLATNTPIFKEQGSSASVVDNRLLAPYFMKGLVLYPTLDGKMIIVNIEQKKRLRTVIVSSEDNFNNVIYSSVVDNKIITATASKILSMSQKDTRAAYEIRNVAFDERAIYIATKQGEVISMTPNLDVNLKIKFPFAHFLGMISLDEKLYLLEKEGYMIVVEKKSFDYSVHEVDFDDGFIFVGKNLFYVDDEKILLK